MSDEVWSKGVEEAIRKLALKQTCPDYPKDCSTCPGCETIVNPDSESELPHYCYNCRFMGSYWEKASYCNDCTNNERFIPVGDPLPNLTNGKEEN